VELRRVKEEYAAESACPKERQVWNGSVRRLTVCVCVKKPLEKSKAQGGPRKNTNHALYRKVYAVHAWRITFERSEETPPGKTKTGQNANESPRGSFAGQTDFQIVLSAKCALSSSRKGIIIRRVL
jgi:hypothetical protein